MSWEPDISVPIDEFQLEALDILTASAENSFNIIPYFEKLVLMESLEDSFLQGSFIFSVLKGEMQSKNVSFTLQDFVFIRTSSIESLSKKGSNTELSEPRPIGGLFYITDIIKREVTNPKVDSYEIYFASTEVLNEYSKKISKSYKNETRTEIIKRITKDFLIQDSRSSLSSPPKISLGVFEESKDKFQCVIPRWSPMKSIDWLTNGCVSVENDDSMSFHFFQTFEDDLERKFNFRSFRTMMKEKPSIGIDEDYLSGYAITPYNSDLNELVKRTLARRTPLRCVIRDMSGLDKMSKGMYSSRLLSHDIVRKTFKEETLKFDNVHVANEKINKALVVEKNNVQEDFSEKFLDSGESYLFTNNDHKCLFRKTETDLGVKKTETWLQGRISQLNTSDFLTLDITLYGDTSRNVGETVMFTTAGLFDQEDDENSFFRMDESGLDLAGKYLISKLVHTFVSSDSDGSLGGKNTTIMTLVKDGLQL